MNWFLINSTIGAAGALCAFFSFAAAQTTTHAAGGDTKAGCYVELRVMFGEHRLVIPMSYWKGPERFPYGWANGPPQPRCGDSRQQIAATFRTVWPDFVGAVPLAKRFSSPPNETWGGLIEFRVIDGNATELQWEWNEGGEPHPAQPLSEMLDWHHECAEKWNDRTTDMTVRRDPAGEIVALTSCNTSPPRTAGCTDYLNHSGLRVEISFAKGLLPHLEAIESGVTKLLDGWSHLR
jgi:hypothetical protein